MSEAATIDWNDLDVVSAARHARALAPNTAAAALDGLNPDRAHRILDMLEETDRQRIVGAAPDDVSRQWVVNRRYEDGTVGRMARRCLTIMTPDMTVGQAIDLVRDLARITLVTYGFVIDDAERLVGLVTMRDLLLNDHSETIGSLMLRDPFAFNATMQLEDAMLVAVNRHYPVYPVIDDDGRLVGNVRGQELYEERTIEISAQAGAMVGVDREERLSTPWQRSLRFRHPWLQLNLLTAFIAAAVVGLFQETIDKIVILAMFLPVLAGQSGNTGCQALAVALRGLTLGELEPGREKAVVFKESLLGLFNGVLVGISAGVGMYVVARAQHHPQPLVLAMIVVIAMVGSCVISGIAGATIPLALKRVGADPATASSIFLTTATDVASMSIFLGLATALLL